MDDFKQFLRRYGLWATIACALGYILIAEVRADQKQMKVEHASLVEEQRNLSRGILKLADKGGETQMLQEKVLWVMRTMCVQQAGNASERNDCLREQK